ncbi:uncharacterized protein si:dkey-24p1.7 [Danio aesculapii]|uniref:uncharacterized protein si:dkey-24p1.7 n=1 Tax=Danio aesculapii TaxID=1142201 RepID=UPI0024C000C4|nr:uncharacterized protein si:dkey-24p1.7 [Danio aesculapii]
MKIILICTLISLLVLNVLCEGEENSGLTTFNPATVIAVPGLCAHISCNFTHPNEAKPIKTIQWKVCDKSGQCNKGILNCKDKANEEKEEQSDLSNNNCCIIIKDIRADEMQNVFIIEDQQNQTYNFTVDISIKYEPLLFVPALSEGVEVNLTCLAYFPCPETPLKITWWIKTREKNVTNLNSSIILKTLKISISYLPLIPMSDLHDATVGCNVSYAKETISTNSTLKVKSQILAEHRLKEGDTLNLTCTVKHHPPASSHDSVRSFNGNTDNLEIQTSAGNLKIVNVRKEHAGIYICERTYMNKTLNASIMIDITVQAQILGENRRKKGDTLNLTCSIKNHPQASSNAVCSFSGDTDIFPNQTSAANLIINNVTKEHAGIYVCEMTYINKTRNASITISITERDMGTNTTLADTLESLLGISNIFTFVAGMAFSALIFSAILCCWVCCHRGKKQKVPTANPDAEINLEMVQTDVAQTGITEQTPLHEQPDRETPESPITPTDGAEEDEAREVDYASIDYSLLKDKPPEEAETEPVDTDYAEIKKDRTKERTDTEDPQDGDEQVETFDQKEMGVEEDLYSQVPQ